MSPAVKGRPSPLHGEYPCTNGCGRVLSMPGAVTRHLRTCATSIEQLRQIGGCENAPDDECWIWPGLAEGERRKIAFLSPVTKSLRKRYVYVVAYILVTGTDPEDGQQKPLICHTCDDGRCFNPRHLFNCTTRENSLDMMSKGRGRPGFLTMGPERQREVASLGGSQSWKTSKQKVEK